jgi:hypothetical protein
MRKAINTEKIEGYVYQHNLSIKTVQNQASSNYGKNFISGNLEVAVDEAGLNVIPVHFTYVTEENASGNKNITYENLKRIIEDNKTWISVGKDAAQKVRINTAIALNDFYNRNDELVSTKTNEGGFVTLVTELGKEDERNLFTADMVVTSVRTVEADPEKNIDKDYDIIKGAIFNFRNDLLPVEFTVKDSDGMSYFEGLGASNSEPVYTKVWGRIECRTIVNTITEESAFGEGSVRTFERKTKEWTITGTAKVPYDFGDESVLTPAELAKAAQDREIMLADTKKRSEEYRADHTASAPATASVVAAPGGFNF